MTVALELTALETGTMFGLYKAAIFCPGPVIAYLYDYKKCRRVLLVLGAVTASVGIVIASVSTSSSFLIAAVTLSGLGRGVVTMLAVIGLSNVQPSRFSTYYGIGKSGYAVGMVVIPLMSDFLLKVYGWRGTFAIIGALMGNDLPLIMSLNVDVQSEDDKGDECRTSLIQEQGDETTSNMAMLDGSWYSYVIPRAMDRGISSSHAIYLAFSAAIATFLGRAFSGAASRYISPNDIVLVMTTPCVLGDGERGSLEEYVGATTTSFGWSTVVQRRRRIQPRVPGAIVEGVCLELGEGNSGKRVRQRLNRKHLWSLNPVIV
ncbi:uncharacterized protein [Diadema antillarum]|uniref:uncharacterized protein n=1 Tax=Diadema antillarum TaxID=105358 RepID=UPI003A83656F